MVRERSGSGWAIWDAAGLHQHQAWDFITDGFRAWQDSGSFELATALQLLHVMFDRLVGLPPAPWPDLYAVPREVVEPVATAHSALCWTASEMIDAMEPSERSAFERRAYDAIASARVEFVPPRFMSFARTYAANHGYGRAMDLKLAR